MSSIDMGLLHKEDVTSFNEGISISKLMKWKNNIILQEEGISTHVWPRKILDVSKHIGEQYWWR